MATRTISTVGGNYNSTLTWAEAAVPTAADNVVATGLSGNLTVNVSSACRSIDLTNYVGTLAVNSTLGIGDGTAGPGNVALRFVVGMTLSGTGLLNVKSTSATQQSLTFAGKTHSGALTFNGSGGSWQLADEVILAAGRDVTVVTGSLDGNNQNVTCDHLVHNAAGLTASITLGTGTWTLRGSSGSTIDFSNAANLTFSGASSTLLLTDTGSSGKTFTGGGKTFGTVTITTGGTGIITFSGSNTFTKIGMTGGTTKTLRFTAGTTQTLTGGADAFPSGAAANLITCESTVAASAWNLSKTGVDVSSDYLSLKDSAALPADTWYAGANSTDVSGNSGWSFTAPVTPPVAAFSGTPLTGTTPVSVVFTDSSTNTPTSWLWEKDSGAGFSNFSDTPTVQNPTEEFTTETWSIKLTATNAGGSDAEEKTDYVVVSAAPVAAVAVTDGKSY